MDCNRWRLSQPRLRADRLRTRCLLLRNVLVMPAESGWLSSSECADEMAANGIKDSRLWQLLFASIVLCAGLQAD